MQYMYVYGWLWIQFALGDHNNLNYFHFPALVDPTILEKKWNFAS